METKQVIFVEDLKYDMIYVMMSDDEWQSQRL